MHSSVEADVRAYLQKESYRESEGMHAGAEARLCSGAANVVEYWPVTLKLIRIYKARALLKEFHAKTLREHQQPADVVDESETANVDEGLMSPEPEEVVMESAEEAGSFSPQLLHHGDGTEGAINPEEDRAALERMRMEVLEDWRRRMHRAMAPKPAPSADDFDMKAIKAMGSHGGR